jgi:hypothetical protein
VLVELSNDVKWRRSLSVAVEDVEKGLCQRFKGLGRFGRDRHGVKLGHLAGHDRGCVENRGRHGRFHGQRTTGGEAVPVRGRRRQQHGRVVHRRRVVHAPFAASPFSETHPVAKIKQIR